MTRTTRWSSTPRITMLAGALAMAALALHAAHAEVPDDAPTFSDPTTFTNEFMPFDVGVVKVFAGRSDGERTAVVDIYLDRTREFVLDGDVVTCRVHQETEFEDGELIEISTNYFACADDGSVYYFGETVDDYEDGVIKAKGKREIVKLIASSLLATEDDE